MTHHIPEWLYDEARTAGTDYGDPAEAAAYDQRSRDQDREAVNRFILEFLDLDSTMTVLDLGAGCGSFALAAAPHCERVIAVDVSAAMLDCAGMLARERGIGNVESRSPGRSRITRNRC